MKIKIILIILTSLLNVELFSQFVVTINSSKPNSCQDSTIEFTAAAKNGAVPVDDVTFTWSFGDGSIDESGLNLDTVNHTFKEGGGFIVRVVANKGADTDTNLLKFEVALTPNFSGTNTDREDPLCLGQQVFLTGKVADSTWKYEVPDTNTEEDGVEVSNLSIYESKFDFRIFNKTQTITAGNNIDTIAINLEHTNLSHVKIELICPDAAKTVVLKDFGGPDKYFGVPIDDEASTQAGNGYDYLWTNSPANGTINSNTLAVSSLPAGSYASEQPFSNLIGCSLNGQWTIKVTDNQVNDKGFVFSTMLVIDASLFPADWEFQHSYTSPLWSGSGVSSTSVAGLATGVPNVHGNHRYTFRLTDNFSCFQDTSVFNTVEAVTLSSNPAETFPFTDTVSFENTTSWSSNSIWNFGDDSEESSLNTPVYTYKEEGTYQVHLTAISDDNCEDTASIFLIVTIPESQDVTMQQAFSPNNDGINERFKIQESDGDNLEVLDCWIYSRWGKKVAEWHSVEEARYGWDGRINGGLEASPGVYYYHIKSVGFDGRVYKKNGSFHLFR